MRYYIHETKHHIAVFDEENKRSRLGRIDIEHRQPDWKGYWLADWYNCDAFGAADWTEVPKCRGRKALKQGGLEL